MKQISAKSKNIKNLLSNNLEPVYTMKTDGIEAMAKTKQ